jgi:hypothetical protein
VNPKTVFKSLWVGFFLLLLYWMARLCGHFPAFMDTIEYVFPEKWFNVESFRQGRIPLWNPYIACGTPHLAAFQPAPFYPFFWIWNLTGLADWFFVVALLHQAFAAVGFYYWGRALKASPLVATFCALGFAGSALMTFYWGFPTHLASIAWIPWVFFTSVRFQEKHSLRWWVWVSICWTLQILAGYPIFTFYAALFWMGWAYWNLKDRLKILVALMGTFLAAMVLSAAQWLPFADFLGSLHRDGWGDYLYDLHWPNFLTLFQPQLLGTPGMAGYKGDYPDFIFNNLYLGMVPLGIFIALFFSPKSKNSFWKGAALFLFFWLPGIHFFVWKILPGTWMDRLEPAKAAFLFVFCAFTALVVGLSEQFQSASRKNKIWKWAWITGALWILDILLVPCRVIQTVPDPYRNEEVRQSAQRAKEMTGEGRLVSLKEAGKFYPAGDGSISDSFRTAAEELVPNTNTVWGLKSARGYLTIYTDGFQDLNRYLKSGYPYDGRVLDAAGVDLILYSHALPAFKYNMNETHGASVWTKNAGALAGAWKVEKVREFPDRAAVFEAMLDPKAFLENEVYTEKSPDGKAVCLAPSIRILSGNVPSVWGRLKAEVAGWFQSGTTLEGSRPSPCEAEFTVMADKGGFLVFDESFAPGWHAWVDGIPKTIFRADGLFMSVVLDESGERKVDFRYEPVSFRLGLFFTLLSLVAGAFALLLTKKSR